MIKVENNIILQGALKRSFLLDAYYKETRSSKPIVIFVHGYKGFKDWGFWHLIAEQFAEAGFVFLKFNLSHNGTTVEHPLDFADLEAFGRNNYSHELSDMEAVINWVLSNDTIPNQEKDTAQIALIGHSRGGAISIVKAAQDPRIKALATWASVSQLDYAWSPERISAWANDGVYYIANSRTKQEMPMYYQMYEDFKRHGAAYDVKEQLKGFDKPMLIVHGTADPGVPFIAAETLKKWYPPAKLHLIDQADHVFGGRHPYIQDKLTDHATELVSETITFLKTI
jgi:pimeloyl-ACP methyl ester carboxylesterase